MVKSPKQETRKTVWRGISVKSVSRPSSTQSNDSSLSWERQPLSPLSQEYSTSIKTPPETPKSEEHHHAIPLQQQQQEHCILDEQRHSSSVSISPSNSTIVSTKSSSNSSSRHKKKKLTSLGSLTKTYDPSNSDHDNDNKHSSSSQKKHSRKEGRATALGSLTKPYEQSERRILKEQERKERKERDKLERKAKKDQEKLDKELKQQQKKELKDQEKLDKDLKEQQKKELKEKAKELKMLKEKERKDRKSKTKSSIFSRPSKSSASTPTDDDTAEMTEDKLTSQVERRSSISFGHHSLSSHLSKPSSGSNLDIIESDSTRKVFEDADTDGSSDEEFVDFADNHTLSHEETSDSSAYQHQLTQPPTPLSPSDYFVQSPLQPRPRSKVPRLSVHLQPETQHASINNQNGVSKHIDSTIQGGTNNSMFYILNSLQDAGRNIEDDELLDDMAVKKMNATQQQTRSSFSYQKHEMQGQQFDQHIQALEIMANRSSISSPPTDPLPPLPTGQTSQRQTHHSGDSILSVDSHQSLAQQNYHPLSNGRLSASSKMSHHSSSSSSSYTTEASTEHNHSTTDHDSQYQGQEHHNRHRSNSYHHAHHHHSSPLASPYGITAISEEELLAATPTPTSSIPGHLTITTTGTGIYHKKNNDMLLDSPIDEYITNENGTNNSNDDANHTDSDDQLDGTDSCSFESTDIPDPFLFPSDGSDNQHIDSRDQQQQSGKLEPATSQRDSKTPAQTTIKMEKDILNEALKVRTSENVSGRQVPVMQVNISHESTLSTSNHTTLLSPMSAIIESTTPSFMQPDDKLLSSKQSLPLRQSSLPPPNESKISSTTITPLDQSPVYVESPATISPSVTVSASLPISTKSSIKMDTATSDTKSKVAPNLLKPRQQEEADQPIKQGIKYLFSNKFIKAITTFESKTESEPLHALVLGSMLLLKAMMTYNEDDIDAAMDALTHTSTIAGIQAELSKETFDDTFSSQFSSLVASTIGDADEPSSTKTFTPNGVLRAYVIQAESYLLMGLLQLTQENMAGYLKCGLNLKKACTGYKMVWKEYQRMGDQVSKCMDENTVSAVQFGVGTLHLLLSSLPPKIVNIFSGLSWKTDKDLGFTLLKSAMSGQGTRSSFASLILLSYYSLLSTSVPSIYAQVSIQETIECLVAAQKSHPKSCFFLYYAARISRVARNVGLSTQSFAMATTSTRRGAWAEVAMKHTSAYEVGLNHAMQLDWDTSAAYFEQLCCARDWSPAFCQYFVGACHEMLGQRQEAKDAFDEVPVISHQQHHRKSFLDNYVQVKVERYQYQDYQDLDSCLPGLELLLLLNAFGSMEDTALRRCLVIIDETCQLIDRDDICGSDDDSDDSVDGDDIDRDNSVNEATMARYGTLLLIRCAVLNSLSRYDECIPHLDWILSHNRYMESEDWLLPFAYWEAGVTHWGLDDPSQSRQLWQLALSCTRYDFEFRMASRIHSALEKCNSLGVPEPSKSATSGRKRI